jgi:hypothetical protein
MIAQTKVMNIIRDAQNEDVMVMLRSVKMEFV